MSEKNQKMKTSDKVKVIDQNTFTTINNEKEMTAAGTATPVKKRLRNAKYRKTRVTYTLMDYLVHKATKESIRLRKRTMCHKLNNERVKNRKTTVAFLHGRKKSRTKLKKIIIADRTVRRFNREFEECMESLNIDGSPEEDAAVTAVTAGTAQSEQPSTEQQLLEQSPAQELLSNPAPKNKKKPRPSRETREKVPPFPKLHSRRFRPYCDNLTTVQLSNLVQELLQKLHEFQKRAYMENMIKARAHRRYVLGFSETKNFLEVNKVKLVIIAPDCEPSEGEGGLDQTIEQIKAKCKDLNIPYVFILNRRLLGKCFQKRVSVACVAVLSYDGMQENFSDIKTALEEARKFYNDWPSLECKTETLSTGVPEEKPMATVSESLPKEMEIDNLTDTS